jgi:hypothetical protein
MDPRAVDLNLANEEKHRSAAAFLCSQFRASHPGFKVLSTIAREVIAHGRA